MALVFMRLSSSLFDMQEHQPRIFHKQISRLYFLSSRSFPAFITIGQGALEKMYMYESRRGESWDSLRDARSTLIKFFLAQRITVKHSELNRITLISWYIVGISRVGSSRAT